MAKKTVVTRFLAVVLVGLSLGATALAAPVRTERARSAASEVSFLDRLLALFRSDELETHERPKVRKDTRAASVRGGGIKPHQSSLRTLEHTELE